jgi:putative PIN family toxin of toxin-antitoxin system
MRFVVVFDTNVLLSAIGWKGNPFQCLELARAGTIEVVTCPEILDELTEKLESRLAQSSDIITETLSDLLSVLRVVSITGELKAIAADPDDDKILECAVVASATYIVSGESKHLLPLGSFRGIHIVSPAEFLTLINQVWDQ